MNYILCAALLWFLGSASCLGEDVSQLTEAMPRNQRVSCVFTGTVIAVSQIMATNNIKGRVIEANPRWEVELDIQGQDRKTPFPSGRRKLYLHDLTSVFAQQPEVGKSYEFTFVWNRSTSDKREIEGLKAKRKQ
jgi:hypothetical protein